MRLRADDYDNDAVSYRIVQTTNGTATLNGDLLTFTPAPGVTSDGSVTYVASDGYADSVVGTITVGLSRVTLANLSTRCFVSGSDEVLIAGFVLAGAGAKTVLVRGGGPALASLGLAGESASPR